MITNNYRFDASLFDPNVSADAIAELKPDEREYYELFKRMSEYSGKPVNDIHSYLYALDDLMHQMRESLNANTYNLLRLPLTEPVFEINPDTREIIVPKQFKENGLTIQGDKLAEIVWFKMPRFFDLTDFYNFKNDGTPSTNTFTGYHTYIEWYNPAAAKTDGGGKGVDLAYAMTCDEDYIYFGWPLADKVSAEAGTIQFTVRFLGVTNGEIQYNFSTKIQSCVIKTTLNFNLLQDNYKADSWEDLIYSRPVYSGVVNSIESPAPIVLQGLVDGYQDLEEVTIEHPAEGTEGEEGYKEPWTEKKYELNLEVKAASPNSANQNQELAFVWYHQVDGMDGLGQVTIDPDDENPPIKTVALTGTGYDIAAKSTYTINKVGRYTVQIGNTIGSDKRTRYVYTGIIEVPRPTEPNPYSNSPRYGYTGNVYHSEADNEPFARKTVLSIQIPSHYSYNTDGEVVNTLIPGDKLSYQWYVQKPTVDEDGAVTYTEPEAVEDANSVTYTPTIEGKYLVGVSAARNGAQTDEKKMSIADVRTPPRRFSEVGAKVTINYDEAAHMFTASINDPDRNPAHKVSYVWYRSDFGAASYGWSVVAQGGVNGLSLNNSKYQVTRSGNYRVEISEVVFDDVPEYKGETLPLYRVQSPVVSITDELTQYQGQTDLGE